MSNTNLRVDSFITKNDYFGHKFLKCYNRKTWKWYLGETEIVVPPESTIVFPKNYYYDSDFDKMYEDVNLDIRSNKIKITRIQKENENDICIPLYYDLMHKNRIEYEEGKTYETTVDMDIERQEGEGFYFVSSKNNLKKYFNSANHQICKYNSRNILSKAYHHLFD
jgi:hypothetical protein